MARQRAGSRAGAAPGVGSVRSKPSVRRQLMDSWREYAQSFWALDERAPGELRRFCCEHRSADALRAVASLSGDETVWFILPVLAGSLLVVLSASARGAVALTRCGGISCEMELCADVFGAMAVCASVEQALKLFFQRPRPACRPYNSGLVCVWGEWFSFPSGHTLRAFYLRSFLVHGAHPRASLAPAAAALATRLALPGWAASASFAEHALWAWAVAVGLSRVAAGRHHPFDVAAGAVVGLALAKLVETDLGDRERALLKAAAGVSVAVQVWLLLLSTLLRMATLRLSGGSEPAARAVVALGAALFFSFYPAIGLVVASLYASGECELGRLSHVRTGGQWRCQGMSAW
jgi:membrane-associated phospholipid phosphatase